LAAKWTRNACCKEAALLVDAHDIQEELVRLDTHVKHFLGLLEQAAK